MRVVSPSFCFDPLPWSELNLPKPKMLDRLWLPPPPPPPPRPKKEPTERLCREWSLSPPKMEKEAVERLRRLRFRSRSLSLSPSSSPPPKKEKEPVDLLRLPCTAPLPKTKAASPGWLLWWCPERERERERERDRLTVEVPSRSKKAISASPSVLSRRMPLFLSELLGPVCL